MYLIHQRSCTAESELRGELAAAYQLAALFQWTDLIYTHISVRVPLEEGNFLINPFGLHFHEITADNLIKVSYDGTILSPTSYTINRAGFVVHSAIHEARSNINAIVHLHTINGMAISALQEGLLPISQAACHFYGKIAFHDYQGISVHEEEKTQLVKSLGDKNVIILRNHGFLTAAPSLAEAFTAMYTLEKAAQVQIAALSMGRPLSIPSHHICEKVVQETGQHNIKNADIEWQALKRLLPNKNNFL
jgi:ribulose-5-phosphate 4-epimerase/fuculose-1-phosphate aldolase